MIEFPYIENRALLHISIFDVIIYHNNEEKGGVSISHLTGSKTYHSKYYHYLRNAL